MNVLDGIEKHLW